MFDIACEAAVAPDPGQGAPDDPAFGQNPEALGARCPVRDPRSRSAIQAAETVREQGETGRLVLPMAFEPECRRSRGYRSDIAQRNTEEETSLGSFRPADDDILKPWKAPTYFDDVKKSAPDIP